MRFKLLLLLSQLLLLIYTNAYAMHANELTTFITHSPKAHLSLHLEGTLTAKLYWKLAHKHHLKTPYQSLSDVEKKIQSLKTLDDFLSLDSLHSSALLDKDDFYQLTSNMLNEQRKQGVTHLEFQFNPENHTMRGVPLSQVVAGITEAIDSFTTKHPLSIIIIASYLKENTSEQIIRHYDALRHVSKKYPSFQSRWVAVGLDSNEKNNPPEKFYRFIDHAKRHGHKIVLHAGHDEAATLYISGYLKQCGTIDRIDHGNMAAFDKQVLERIYQCKMPVALCPISEINIGPMKDIQTYPIKTFLNHHILVSINADDPAYLQASLVQNYVRLAKAQHLKKDELMMLFSNSFQGSLLSTKKKEMWLNQFKRLTVQSSKQVTLPW